MNKTLFLLIFISFSFTVFSQTQSQESSCAGTEDGSYFPINIQNKKLMWSGTYYVESIIGTKEINGKEYTTFKQTWENQNSDLMYLREEDGIVYQYEECCEQETIRYDRSLKKGASWKTADGASIYKVMRLDGTLETPYCKYTNLLVIKASTPNGTFNFYYLKGEGYIGATYFNKLISFVEPDDN